MISIDYPFDILLQTNATNRGPFFLLNAVSFLEGRQCHLEELPDRNIGTSPWKMSSLAKRLGLEIKWQPPQP